MGKVGQHFLIWVATHFMCGFLSDLTALCVVWEVIALRKRSTEALRLSKLLAQD